MPELRTHPSRRRPGARLVPFATGLLLAAGLAAAQGTPPPVQGQPAAAAPGPLAADPAAVAGVPTAAAATATGSNQRSSTLTDLGIDYEMTLRGIQGSAGVRFSVRTDEIVERATLDLKYSYSPSLIPELSHVKVSVNGVAVATLPVNTADAGKPLSATVELDPRLITDYNQINLQLIGHYTRDCEDPDHTSLWANIDRSSTLNLTVRPVALANDLSLLPVPFFDSRDVRRLDLPFYFPQRPDLDTLQVAGVVASWFGSLANYRGATFPVSTGVLPSTGNAVVLATPETLPQALAVANPKLADIRGPMLAVAPNPGDPNGKLLLVLGRNVGELRAAANALVLRAPLSGDIAMVDGVEQPAARKPYDAPRWISSDHPTRFGELVTDASLLSVSGYHPDLIRVGLRLPPDLFVWDRKGIPVNLRYRYTVPESLNKSALNVNINDAFVTTLPLDGRPYAESMPVRWWHDLTTTRDRMPIQQKLLLPVGPFSADSQLRFHFFFDRPTAAECKQTLDDVSASIDADSTIDLSSFSHYMAMPNLASYANAGFPFTRMADLSNTVIVLPNNANERDFSNVLTLLGHFGSSTGYPALNVKLTMPGDMQRFADSDLLVLGSPRSQPLFRTWQDVMPVGQANQQNRFALSDWVFSKLPDFLSANPTRTDLPTASEVSLQQQPGDVLLMGFESPLHSGRSVVAIQSDDPGNLDRLFEVWSTPKELSQIQGSVVLLQQEKVLSMAGNQTYYVGKLPWTTWLRWYFSQNPLGLAGIVIIVCVIFGFLVARVLRWQAARRLRGGDKA